MSTDEIEMHCALMNAFATAVADYFCQAGGETMESVVNAWEQREQAHEDAEDDPESQQALEAAEEAYTMAVRNMVASRFPLAVVTLQ